jgi:hypothetical protein
LPRQNFLRSASLFIYHGKLLIQKTWEKFKRSIHHRFFFAIKSYEYRILVETFLPQEARRH